MNYRKATSNDLYQVAELFDGYRVFYRKPTDINAAKTFISERLKQNDSEIIVAEYEQQNIIGFTQLYTLFSSTRMQKLWILNDLFVNPNARTKGVGVGLIEKAKELVIETKACGMFLETEKSNKIGNNLYPKTGFTYNSASNYYEWNP